MKLVQSRLWVLAWQVIHCWQRFSRKAAVQSAQRGTLAETLIPRTEVVLSYCLNRAAPLQEFRLAGWDDEWLSNQLADVLLCQANSQVEGALDWVTGDRVLPLTNKAKPF